VKLPDLTTLKTFKRQPSILIESKAAKKDRYETVDIRTGKAHSGLKANLFLGN
jgi:hypothetical protein